MAACQAPAQGQPEQAGPATTAAAAPAASVPTRPAANPAGTWHLVFNGTFPGGTLNTADWSTGWLAEGITPPVSKGELECYDPANVTVAGGALNLSLLRQPHSCGGRVRPYSSGMVNTDGKFQFTYGFMQARIWMPGRRGQIVNWPGSRGNCPAGTFYNGWHTFGADWEPRSITYYYDGRIVGTIRSGVTHSPMYLILNNATTHLYQIPLHVPADMRVAYVRVWQHPGQ